jgi:hypothetical protein
LVVSRGDPEANRSLNLSPALLLDDGQARAAFGVQGTLSAVLVDGRGRLALEVARGAGATRALLAEARGPRVRAPT